MLFTALAWFILGCVVGVPSCFLETIVAKTRDVCEEKKASFGKKSARGYRHPVVLGFLAIYGIVYALWLVIAVLPVLLMLPGNSGLLEAVSYCVGWFLTRFQFKKWFNLKGIRFG